MRIRVRCTGVVKGSGWEHAQFVTENDGSVSAWHRDTPTSRFFIPITTADHFGAFVEGASYWIDFAPVEAPVNEELAHVEEAPWIQEGSSADQPAGGSGPGESGGDLGRVDPAKLGWSEEEEPPAP
jgi:hypothetical protein